MLVLANNCRDGTADIAAGPSRPRLQGRVAGSRRWWRSSFAGADAHVGTARRQAMDAAAERVGPVGITPDHRRGCASPAGLGRGQSSLPWRLPRSSAGAWSSTPPSADPRLDGLHRDIELYWSAVRALEERLDPQPHDPAPRHGDHTGASLALRVATYRSVGGLPPLPRGEDNALVARVVEAGGRLQARSAGLRPGLGSHRRPGRRRHGDRDGAPAGRAGGRGGVSPAGALPLAAADHPASGFEGDRGARVRVRVRRPCWTDLGLPAEAVEAVAIAGLPERHRLRRAGASAARSNGTGPPGSSRSSGRWRSSTQRRPGPDASGRLLRPSSGRRPLAARLRRRVPARPALHG